MVKYRSLSTEELTGLEKEFVEYLILNGITAPDWENMKTEEAEKAARIIDLFSDVVFEGVMRKIRFLEWRSPNEVKAIQCLEEKMVIVGMISHDKDTDFTDTTFIEKAKTNPPADLKIYTKEVIYSEGREIELFTLTESGFKISEGNLFKSLCLGLPGL